MAELHVLGPWEGPCEETTANFLAQNLPKEWNVVAGRKLPSQNRDDIDFIVVGLGRIFVVEEKCWGPSIVIGDRKWEVRKLSGHSDFRPNPQDAATSKAKKVKTWLKSKVSNFDSSIRGMAVVPIVVLSHGKLSVKVRNDVKDDAIQNVLLLSELVSELTSQDVAGGSSLGASRASLLSEILDQAPGEDLVSSIGDYIVDEKMSGDGVYPDALLAQFYRVHNKFTEEEFELQCFPLHSTVLGNSSNKASLVREIVSLKKVSHLGRTCLYGAPFEDSERNWFVVPIERGDGAIKLTDIQASGFVDTKTDDLALISDAFSALAELNAEGIIHKYLSPQTLELSKSRRVRFSHFFLSHFESQESVVMVQDQTKLGFQPPEVQTTGAFSFASDVYSLAATLTCWLLGDPNPSALESLKDYTESSGLAKLFARCLDSQVESRPSPAQIIKELRGLQSSDDVFDSRDQSEIYAAGSVILSRFELKRKLGAGGLGIAWLAEDMENSQSLVVVKQLRSSQSYEAANVEYQNSRVMHSIDFSRGVMISDKPENGFLSLTYLEGETVQEMFRRNPPTSEQSLELLIRIINLVDKLHAKGYVHGDLNTANVIVDEDWLPKLIDFGLMRKIGENFAPLGTPMFIPPEVLSQEACDATADYFTLAASYVHLILGRSPFEGQLSRILGRSFNLVPATKQEMMQWDELGQGLITQLYAFLKLAKSERPSTAMAMSAFLLQARPLEPELLPPLESKRVVNKHVDEIRKLYTASVLGAEGAVDLATAFSWATYVQTSLDKNLLPLVIAGEYRAVFLTGNPGDGKTSFIQQVEKSLIESDAKCLVKEDAFWEYSLDGKTFGAVLDCSASFRGRSADEIVTEYLKKGADEEYTAMFAINDGRLRNFFENAEDEFPDHAEKVDAYFDGAFVGEPDLVIVDLKNRSLDNASGTGLASEIIEKVTSPEIFEDCSNCTARLRCPIYRNQGELRGSAQKVVSQLVLQSHLRRGKRATIRRVRSAIGWILTGDMGCEEVHSRLERNEDLTGPMGFGLSDLAFSMRANDALINEWSMFDPATSIDVDVQNLVNGDRSVEAQAYPPDVRYAHSIRKKFFALADVADGSSFSHSSLYESISVFTKALANEIPEILDIVLKGISAVLGAPGYRGDGLALTMGSSQQGWTFIKSIPSSDLKIVTREPNARFVEGISDELVLQHKSGDALNLPLDVFELIFRAYSGETLIDDASESIRFEVQSFANRLLRSPANAGIVVSPGGALNLVSQHPGGVIKLDSEDEQAN